MTDMMGPAGSGYALLWDAQKKELSSIDYNGVAPAATDPKKFDMSKKLRGAMAPTVPGALKGWEAVHKKCGNRPWAELWQDAINYAENGWPVDTESNFHIKRHIAELGINETWAKEFLVNNDAPGAGYILKRKALAETYKAFAAKGSDALYKGEVGDKIVAFLKKEGGLISKEDLLKYEVKWNQPIQTTYRGYTVYGVPPSSSSITWMQILNIVEGYDLKALGHNTPDYLHRFIEATKHAYMDAYRYNGDPAFVNVPVDRLLSKDYATELREKIADQCLGGEAGQADLAALAAEWNRDLAHGDRRSVGQCGLDDQHARHVLRLRRGCGGYRPRPVERNGLVRYRREYLDRREAGRAGHGARQAQPVDAGAGNAVQGRQVVHGGRRRRRRDDHVGIAQPIVNAIDFGMDAQAALYAPRFRYGDIYHYTGGTEAWLEPGIKPEVREALIKKGHKMSPADKPRVVARGTTQMIVIDQKSGAMIGGAAPQGRDNLTAY